jgi:lipopolysaccharide transport system permease protein
VRQAQREEAVTLAGNLATAEGEWRPAASESDRRPVVVIRPPRSITTGLLQQVTHLPAYWDLLLTLTVHRVKVRYKQSALGWLWAILQPLLLMLIFTVLFALTAPRMPSEGLPYSVFVYAAVLPWTFFSTAVSNGTNSLVSHTQLVTKIWFPREILPLSYITAALFDFLVASTLLVALMLYHGVAPARYIVLAVPIVGLIAVLASAIALAMAALQVRFRDVGLAMPLLLQVWMFLSPVVYPYSQVPGRFRPLYQLNPMAGLIEGFRRVTVQGQPPDWHLILISALVSAALLPGCYLYFKYVEATLADRM